VARFSIQNFDITEDAWAALRSNVCASIVCPKPARVM
jgi:hypothetical protein